MNNKKKNVIFLINFVLVFILMIGCSKSSSKSKMTDFISDLKNDTGYDVEYIEDRETIRLTDYLSKDTIIEAVSEDDVYNQWIEMRKNVLNLYSSVKELGESNNIKDIECEIVIIDKESAKTDEEVPLLIVNDTGILLDIVEEIRNQ